LTVFKLLGVLVLLYVAYAAARGEVFAKAGASGRTVSRAESPQYFWVVVAIYAGLGIALLTVF
jgi:threonine/homoserine/homoserine lactone efflux protein